MPLSKESQIKHNKIVHDEVCAWNILYHNNLFLTDLNSIIFWEFLNYVLNFFELLWSLDLG